MCWVNTIKLLELTYKLLCSNESVRVIFRHAILRWILISYHMVISKYLSRMKSFILSCLRLISNLFLRLLTLTLVYYKWSVSMFEKIVFHHVSFFSISFITANLFTMEWFFRLVLDEMNAQRVWSHKGFRANRAYVRSFPSMFAYMFC